MSTTKKITVDGALFDPSAIAPETNSANQQIEDLLASLPSILDIGHEEVRRRRAAGEGLLGTEPTHERAQWETASARGHSCQIRVVEPIGEARGVYLHIHGGGHMLGSAGAQDQTLVGLADRLDVAVVSVEYRLAPEHPWPAGADDCFCAAEWLIEHCQQRFGTDHLLIGGDSAGGHLSVITLLQVRDKLGQMPFLGANLLYGIYDMAGTPSARNWGTRNLIINTPIIDHFCDHLLPPAEFPPERRRQPDISPLYAPLEGLCPALFTVGTLDPIVDDSTMLAARWVSAGNAAELAVYPGGIHVFERIPGLPMAKVANQKIDSFLDSCLPPR